MESDPLQGCRDRLRWRIGYRSVLSPQSTEESPRTKTADADGDGGGGGDDAALKSVSRWNICTSGSLSNPNTSDATEEVSRRRSSIVAFGISLSKNSCPGSLFFLVLWFATHEPERVERAIICKKTQCFLSNKSCFRLSIHHTMLVPGAAFIPIHWVLLGCCN